MSNLYPKIGNPNVSTALYPGIHTGIDLRYEMDLLLREFGYHIVIRHFDKTKRSKYWNQTTREAVGGPAWEYTDHVVRARKVLRQTEVDSPAGLEMPHPAGLLSIPQVTFYVKWDSTLPYDICNEDLILEISWNSSRAPNVSEVISNVTNRYNILEAADLLGDSGRREYYICLTRVDIGGK
jgi:hypothetical protein